MCTWFYVFTIIKKVNIFYQVVWVWHYVLIWWIIVNTCLLLNGDTETKYLINIKKQEWWIAEGFPFFPCFGTFNVALIFTLNFSHHIRLTWCVFNCIHVLKHTIRQKCFKIAYAKIVSDSFLFWHLFIPTSLHEGQCNDKGWAMVRVAYKGHVSEHRNVGTQKCDQSFSNF